MATNRETARDALVVLLEADLVGAGKPVKTVSGSKQPSLEGITPLVGVLSRGSIGKPLTFAGNRRGFEFIIQVWVLQSGDNWTYAEAEDALDEIEALIAGVFEANAKNDSWDILRYAENTAVAEVVIAGVPYYLENIPVSVLLKGS